VFADAAARDAAITAPAEGQFAYTKDTNGLWYYDSSAWVASGATGDIEGVTAGVGITGGGTSGTVTVTNSMATAITTAGDLIKGTGSGTFDRLGIGSTGDVLTVAAGTASWAAPAGGGGKSYSLLSTTTLTGAAAFTISGLSGYDDLLIMIKGFKCGTANSEVRIIFNSNTTANNYWWYGGRTSSDTSYSANYFTEENSYSNSNITLFHVGTVATGSGSGAIRISGCNSTGMKAFSTVGAVYQPSGHSANGFVAHGICKIESVITTMTATSTQGNFTAGTMYIYGAA
jgi:hypothetical protein